MLDHDLRVQDPSDENTSYLLESISAAAKPAGEAVAVFAFASQKGVDLFLGEPSVTKLLKRGIFRVIVGIDAITNRQTLEHLVACAAARHNLKVQVFWNDDSSTLFHPKLCYFKGAKRHTAIVGSGNLTPGGLRDNFEAFTVTNGSPKEMAGVDNSLKLFLTRQKSAIRDIDEKALARAALNKSPTKQGKANDVEPEDNEKSTTAKRQWGDAARILLAEVPSHGNRWQQVNFDLDTVKTFFRADAESKTTRLVFLNEVHDDDTLGPDEVRPCVLTKKSKNVSIQLRSHAGEEYPSPSAGRPIVVFRERKIRHFAYCLLMPGQPGYSQLRKLLAALPSPKNRVRRRTMTLAELMSGWKKCPLGDLRTDSL